MNKEKRKHILVDIKTHKEVKLLAAEYGITLGKVIVKLLEERKNV